MSITVDGYLMLGWEVEVEDAKNYDVYDGPTEDADEALASILGVPWDDTRCVPIVFWSEYAECEKMWIGLTLMDWESGDIYPGEYGEFLIKNADKLTEAARCIYRAIMGEQPVGNPPSLMCVGSMG